MDDGDRCIAVEDSYRAADGYWAVRVEDGAGRRWYSWCDPGVMCGATLIRLNGCWSVEDPGRVIVPRVLVVMPG